MRHWHAIAMCAALALLAACSDDDNHHPERTPTALPTAQFTATPMVPGTASPTAASGAPTPTQTIAMSPTTPRTPTATATVTHTFAGVVLEIDREAVAEPGERVDVSVRLSAGSGVSGTQNDISFPPEVPIVAKANRKPDCLVNQEIDKGGTSFAFLPPNCIAGIDCTGVRALVLALDNVDPIPVGAVLYSCRFEASPAAAGEYPIRCSNALASDADGNALATTCTDGSIGSDFFPIPTPTPTVGTPTGGSNATATITALIPTATRTVRPTVTSTPTPRTGAEGALAPLTAAGRWLVDDLGRVVILHGVNMVAKRDPFYPSAFGFADDDAAFLQAEGFNALRLGVDFRGLMPTPGVVENAYVDHLAETVATLVARGIFVLMDFHQDGFAPIFNGNGLPDWMAISDGLPNPPDAVFPLYYIQNPAMQRAFENFWANREGPGGVGIQDYFLQGVEAIMSRFATEARVLGTEMMNEPWPGANWMPCALEAAGCPDQEAQSLGPFYVRGATSGQRLAPDKLVWVEPFVLFNFGMAVTTLPGPDARVALSFHSYALDIAGEEGVVAKAVAAAERDERPVICTEFGASTDPVLLNRLTAQMEQGLLPWMFWSYDENIINLEKPATEENVTSLPALAALVRPYPVATAGTPTQISFDPATRAFHFAYDTTGPGGATYPNELVTVVSVPARHYAGGYVVTVDGAEVTSASGAPLLTLRTSAGATHVTVEITPAS